MRITDVDAVYYYITNQVCSYTLFLSVVSCLKLSNPSLEESSKIYKESLRSPINLCPSRAYKWEDTTLLTVLVLVNCINK